MKTLQDLANYHRHQLGTRIIGITGTNGKTTTTQMCQYLLEKFDSCYGGNIGVPLSGLNKDKKIWILETSSFTLHYTKKAKPNIYILLPITEDHITWHGNFDEYKKATACF